jgi:aspartyl-tRNA synthetase
MTRTLINNLRNNIASSVTISGWVHAYRNQGKMAFLELRDRSGIVQAIALPNCPVLETAKQLRAEWVVTVTGNVNQRPENMVKAGVQNGDIELEITDIVVVNQAETPVFDITADTREVDEMTRLSSRYLDMRSLRLQNNLRMRHRVIAAARNFLDGEDFVEVETPILTKSTPEGARDYIVPSRVYPGSFYALPQSPQQYKQLLMVGGIERYYQLAKCMRDEDSRGDRQPEFTQLDMEMSFVEREDVMDLNERLLIHIVETLYPEKKIQEKPFPRITYKDAMEKYGSDRPDLRNDKEDPNLLAFCWVVDFPFFESTEVSDNPDTLGAWTFTHNPFSAAIPEHREWLMEGQNIGQILTTQYDIALNGYEIGGGSIRNHQPEALKKVFEILGYDSETIEKNFGHMLKALASGAPSHGGIAWGFDRLLMLLQNEPNIREVIAFPKTRDARDPMMESPAVVDPKQLRELKISIEK